MRTSSLIKSVAGGTLVACGMSLAFFWTVCRVYVPAESCAVRVRKTGEALPPGQTIAEEGQKGIQRVALGPGRYFFMPWLWQVELHPLTEISAGDPQTWREVFEAGDPDYSVPTVQGKWPQVGIVTSLAGKPSGGLAEVVPAGYQGIQRDVLSPGTYRINPRAYKIETVPAVVVPLGCCGVVTSQLGELAGTEIIQETTIGPDGEPVPGRRKEVLKLADEGQRGVLKSVLPPGIYYLNNYVHKVKIVQIGYNQISQLRKGDVSMHIQFPSADGFTISVDVTVVWGRHPQHVPEMLNRVGEVAKIREIVRAQIRSICRNIGSQYISTDFIQGEKRELYQINVTETLQRACRERDIEILIALVRDIEVLGGSGDEEMDLKKTIQRGHIAQEDDLTRQGQRKTAEVRADLETAKVAITVAREQISAETRKKVAEVMADGQKTAEEIDAQRDLEVAQIEKKIAELDAEMTRVLGGAEAQVERLANQAEADGKRMFVQAFGSGAAYNLYTFAQAFEPESIRLIFAGEGTFWTDLTRLQDAAAMELLKNSTEK